jgi:hypothetical protein
VLMAIEESDRVERRTGSAVADPVRCRSQPAIRLAVVQRATSEMRTLLSSRTGVPDRLPRSRIRMDDAAGSVPATVRRGQRGLGEDRGWWTSARLSTKIVRCDWSQVSARCSFLPPVPAIPGRTASPVLVRSRRRSWLRPGQRRLPSRVSRQQARRMDRVPDQPPGQADFLAITDPDGHARRAGA